MANFIKIETNNFEAVYVRPEDVIGFNRKCIKGHVVGGTVTSDRYTVLMALTTGEKIFVFESDNMDAADKFIEGMIQNIANNMEDYLPQRFDLPNYSEMPNEWRNICQTEDEEWKSC